MHHRTGLTYLWKAFTKWRAVCAMIACFTNYIAHFARWLEVSAPQLGTNPKHVFDSSSSKSRPQAEGRQKIQLKQACVQKLRKSRL